MRICPAIPCLRQGKLGYRTRILPFACLLLLWVTPARAEDALSLENKVKAACLYNFAKFVEWPDKKFAEPDAPIVIGIVGDDPFGTVLDDTVRGRTAQDRRVVVKRFRTAEDAKDAHIVYVGRLDADARAKALQTLSRAGALTVGENGTFLADGGMVRFAIRDDKLSFDVEPDHLKNSGLKMSAHLLRLANIVRTGEK